MKICRNMCIALLACTLLFSGCARQKSNNTTENTNENIKQIRLESFLKNDDEENTDNAKEILEQAASADNFSIKNTENSGTSGTNKADVTDTTSVSVKQTENNSTVENSEAEEIIVISESQENKSSYNSANGKNIIPEASSTFETASSVSDTGWTEVVGAIQSSEIVQSDYGKCLHFTKKSGGSASFYSLGINLAKYVTEKGRYVINFNYKTNLTTDIRPFGLVIRCDKEYDFTTYNSSSSNYLSAGTVNAPTSGQWGSCTIEFTATSSDILNKKMWTFCMHQINADVTDVYIDNFTVAKEGYDDKVSTTVSNAQTWVANEVVLISSREYANPFDDVDVDLILTDGETTYTIPCFWDGDYIWKARFYCPTVGTWAYKTVCTNTSDSGLHNVRSAFVCKEYSGDLDVYKHGLVDVKEGNKYFTYSDGKAFFYLGDTHWSLGGETLELITEMCEKRSAQGFTVVQSEPLGASFKFENGIDDSDIGGLRYNDQKFKTIADAGLTHVTTSFFYPSGMEILIQNFGGYSDKAMGNAAHTGEGGVISSVTTYDLSTTAKTYLQKICRYWAARYSAYPVMWSLGQEVDNDFFWDRTTFNSHEGWNYVNNPYRLVAEYLNQYDAYKHPLTAHQEGTSNLNNSASTSAFTNVPSHNWFATQWSPALNSQLIKIAPESYYLTTKPSVLYEGRYCYLWTKNFGARLQGWAAFLNGMCGYGWGGQDTWSYTNTYNENADSSDSMDTIKAEEKQFASYRDSFEYKSAYQSGYMRTFFEEKVGEWYDLIPWFASSATFTPSAKAYYYFGTLPDYSRTVFYFYNTDTRANLDASGATSYHELDTEKLYPYYNSSFPEKSNTGSYSPKNTGSVKGFPTGTYSLTWFNPVTNTYSSAGTLTITSTTTSKSLPTKPVGQDMVLLMVKN